MSHTATVVVTACGSCQREVVLRDAEVCWFCGDDLCLGCHTDVGHCGHPAAHKINELARKGPIFQGDIDRILEESPRKSVPQKNI